MTEKRIIALATKAYISIMGLEKWNSLTDSEKHDAVMTIIADFYNKIS